MPEMPAHRYYPATVYDLFDFSGYFTGDKHNGWMFFDSQKNRGLKTADPYNGVLTDTTGAANPCHGWARTQGSPDKQYGIFGFGNSANGIYYPGKNLPMFVIDMTGLKDITDVTKKFRVISISGLDAEEAGRKIWFYNMDKILQKPISQRWACLARPDSLLVPFDSLTNNGFSNTWIMQPCDSSMNDMRFIGVRIDGGPDQHNSKWNELVINGRYLYDTAAQAKNIRPLRYTGALPSQKNSNYTYGKKIGTNLQSGVAKASLVNDGPLRIFTASNYFDTANAVGVPAAYRYFYSIPTTYDLATEVLKDYQTAGHEIWFTNSGGNAYNSAHGYYESNQDTIGKENRTAAQWKRAGDLAYNFAAKFGSVAVPAANTKWKDDEGYSNGMRLFDKTAFGNESWAHGLSYLSLFFQHSVQYDGHENTVGIRNRTGVKAADPNFKLMLSAMVDADTNQVKTMWFLSQWLRTDKKFPADIIDFHKYFTNRDSANGGSFTWADQVGQHGEAPEWAGGASTNVTTILDEFARNIYKYLDTSICIYWTENGRGNTGSPARSEADAATAKSYIQTPAFGKYNSLEAKAILSTRTELFAAASTAITRYNEYALTNQYGDTVQRPTPYFYSFGRGADISTSAPFNIRKFYPQWHFRAVFYHYLQNYYFDTTILEGGRNGRWQMRFRHAYVPDSIITVVWLGSYNGSSKQASIDLGAILPGPVTEVIPSFTMDSGTITTLTPSHGVISTTIDERPVLYLSKQAALAAVRAPAQKKISRPRSRH